MALAMSDHERFQQAIGFHCRINNRIPALLQQLINSDEGWNGYSNLLSVQISGEHLIAVSSVSTSLQLPPICSFQLRKISLTLIVIDNQRLSGEQYKDIIPSTFLRKWDVFGW
jgi:hypothetical protein